MLEIILRYLSDIVKMALFLPVALFAAELDEALILVTNASPVIAEQELVAQSISRQSNWSSKVRVGYSLKSTDTDAAGLNAGLTVEIPLFSRKREIEAAKARHALVKSRDQLQREFLSDVAKLQELEAQQAEAAEMQAFYRDRLTYFRKAVEEGRVESDTLWSDAEKAKKAEHDHHQGAVKLEAALEETARKYGGGEWKRLQALLAAHVKPSKP